MTNNCDFVACPDCGKPAGEGHRHDPDCVHLDINYWIERTGHSETVNSRLVSSLEKIARFAPGNGEECELIARIARNALEDMA